MGRSEWVWLRVAPERRRRRVGSLYRRILELHGRRMDVGELRRLGRDLLPLWTLGGYRWIRMVLGAWLRMGTGVGFLAQQRRIHRLGTASSRVRLGARPRSECLGGHQL